MQTEQRPKARIVVLDSEAPAQSTVCDLLRRCDFRVTATSSVDRAREAVATEHTDLVVVDADTLPDSRSLSALAPVIVDLPCVILSAELTLAASDDDDDRTIQLLQKPFRMEELLDAVALAIMSMRSHRQLA